MFDNERSMYQFYLATIDFFVALYTQRKVRKLTSYNCTKVVRQLNLIVTDKPDKFRNNLLVIKGCK